MNKLIIILYLLCSITLQAKETKANKTAKKPLKSELHKKSKPLKHLQPQWGVWDAIVDFADWLTSPFRPVWGDYKEDGMRAGNPWPKTMFPRSVNDDIPAMVNTIRDKVIIEGSFENIIYKTIYENAQKNINTYTDNFNEDYGKIPNENGVSANFAIAKNAAFVYMIGKRPVMVNGSYDLTTAERKVFLNKALFVLQQTNVYGSEVDGIGINLKDELPIPLNGNRDKIQYRSKELIMLCQAYDILETCKNRLGLLNGHNFDFVRSNIKGFAVSMYRDLNGLFGLRTSENNYTLMPCGALGIAAIVLNECGAGYFYDGWKADNWARIAHWGMMECLFDASYGAVSKKGDVYSFSEGPGYFQYSII